jgi:hypothetical protein
VGDFGVENSTKLGIAGGFCILAGLEFGMIPDGTSIETPTAALGYVFLSWFSTATDSMRHFW